MDREIIMLVLNYAVRVLVLVVGTYAMNFIRQHKLEKWVKVAVYSAEQIYKEVGMGEIKKEYVINFINDKFKFGITEKELDSLIEAVVKELNLLQVQVK